MSTSWVTRLLAYRFKIYYYIWKDIWTYEFPLVKMTISWTHIKMWQNMPWISPFLPKFASKSVLVNQFSSSLQVLGNIPKAKSSSFFPKAPMTSWESNRIEWNELFWKYSFHSPIEFQWRFIPLFENLNVREWNW